MTSNGDAPKDGVPTSERAGPYDVPCTVRPWSLSIVTSTKTPFHRHLGQELARSARALDESHTSKDGTSPASLFENDDEPHVCGEEDGHRETQDAKSETKKEGDEGQGEENQRTKDWRQDSSQSKDGQDRTYPMKT